jgi:hypothetical protein
MATTPEKRQVMATRPPAGVGPHSSIDPDEPAPRIPQPRPVPRRRPSTVAIVLAVLIVLAVVVLP